VVGQWSGEGVKGEWVKGLVMSEGVKGRRCEGGSPFTPSFLHSFIPSLLHCFAPSPLHPLTPFSPVTHHFSTHSLFLNPLTPSLLHSFTPSFLLSFAPFFHTLTPFRPLSLIPSPLYTFIIYLILTHWIPRRHWSWMR
jgi:hypothetical protein